VLASIESSIETLIWGIVSVGITIAVAYWVLGWFLPLDEWGSALWQLISGRKVVVRCRKCGKDNPKDVEFCSGCGEKL